MSQPEATIAAYFSAINRKDADAWVACFAADGVAFDPAHAPARSGSGAHRAFFEGVAALFLELDFRPGTPFVCGSEAAVPFRARCVAKNGRSVEVEGIDVFAFDSEGKVHSVRGYWDPGPLFEAAQVD